MPVAAAWVPVAPGSLLPQGALGAPGSNIDDALGKAVLMTQKTSQCCKPCCLQPNIHWTIKPMTTDEDAMPTISEAEGKSWIDAPPMMFVRETAGFLGRCFSFCGPGSRKTKYETFAGEDDTGELLFYHDKDHTMGVNQVVGCNDKGQFIRCPCCCCLPYLKTKKPDGEEVGKTIYLCDMCLCVPKFMVSKRGEPRYLIRPDVCCGGVCVKCKCGGKKKGGGSANCCKIPFYVRDPVTKEKIDEAQITDMWAGFRHEMCTKRDLYMVMFPKEADVEDKALLLGATNLIDICLNEQETD